ncbi:MAG TPA: translation initiation factor IF-2 [Candidatus Nitrosocosmicus sp.]|nr:translation initiation factor IF-2 [Candidatus Nitrosocosmicus sp.]
MHLRQPVVVVLGHVDSGKTSLLDKIRGTVVQSHEAGGITQHIGASFFPIEIIQSLTGPLFKKISSSDNPIPGLLVIDTPGHEVFANLRMRGGSAADIAILVVDVNKGFEPQTIESINILKKRKVPFVVAINKVDRITGWKNSNSDFISEEIKIQSKEVQLDLDNKVYSVLGSLSELGFTSEAFWRVKDFSKEIALVPVSAVSGVGIPELLTVLVGLTQQYMTQKLERHEGTARGIILEVKEEIGIGPSANIILLDGVIKQGDLIVVAKRESAVTTKIKSLLLPKPLDEMRDPRDKFRQVDMVISAAGLKITSPDLEGVVAGSPLYGLTSRNKENEIKKIVESEIKSVIVNTDSNGIILRCDTIGSIEAISEMLKKEKIPIRSADIGQISRRDVMTAAAVKDKDRYLGIILGFNVKILEDAEKEAFERGIKVFNEKIIYNLVRNYMDWVSYQKEHEESILFNELPPICKIEFMKGYVFRRSDPAVFGAEINIGKIKQKMFIMDKVGKKVGIIHQIQDKGKTIDEATRGMQVAVSINGPQIGRQINEGDIFYTYLNSHQAKLLLGRFNHKLNEEEKTVLDYIVTLRRKSDPAFGYI